MTSSPFCACSGRFLTSSNLTEEEFGAQETSDADFQSSELRIAAEARGALDGVEAVGSPVPQAGDAFSAVSAGRV